MQSTGAGDILLSPLGLGAAFHDADDGSSSTSSTSSHEEEEEDCGLGLDSAATLGESEEDHCCRGGKPRLWHAATDPASH